jgi:hypothetical protein
MTYAEKSPKPRLSFEEWAGHEIASEATPDKRDIVFDFISNNPKVLFSRKLRSQLGIIVRISRRLNARKRHQNKHLGF